MANRELNATGRRHRSGELYFVVTLPDGSKTELPAWMTEAEASVGAEPVERPLPSVGALKALRQLFDALELLGDRPVERCPPSEGDAS